jgi:hypothetical protein
MVNNCWDDEELESGGVSWVIAVLIAVIYQILPSPTPVLQGQLQSVLCLGQLHTSETPDLVQPH